MLVRQLFQANLTNKHSVRKTGLFRRHLEDLNKSYENFTTLRRQENQLDATMLLNGLLHF
jgi:hypothetical protein